MYFALKHRSGRNVWFYELEAVEVWSADMKRLDPSIELAQFPVDRALERLEARARGYWDSMSPNREANLELPEIILPQRGHIVRELAPPFMA